MKYIYTLLTLLIFTGTAFAQHLTTYQGADYCMMCHNGGVSSHYAPWSESSHAQAFDSVSVIQADVNCLPCHTTGWDTENADGGFDDFWTTSDQTGMDDMKNVQCESCHTPSTDPVITLGADNCGSCHEGDHHPTYSDWESSLHAVSKFTSIPGGSFDFIASDANCSACHTAEGFIQFIETSDLVPSVEAPGPEGNDLTCAACHDPHTTELRMDPVELCAKCHNPEYNPDSPEPDGSAIHHSTAYMLEGKGGYEYDGYTYQNSLHTVALPEKCITCHVHTTPFEDPIPANTGHSFSPRGESCVACHGDFVVSEIEDFDYREIQTEIEGLTNELGEKLAMATTADSSTQEFLRAKFNYDFVHADGSNGIHNTKYARGLLTSSIENFSPTTAIEPDIRRVPDTFVLNQNYPNPFNPATSISFQVPFKTHVTLTIYSISGQVVATLVDQILDPGEQNIRFNANGLTSGLYFYKLSSGSFSEIKRMVYIK